MSDKQQPEWEPIAPYVQRLWIADMDGWIVKVWDDANRHQDFFVPRPSFCPHGDPGLCMVCLAAAVRDGMGGGR